jgi:hypothetical protein
MAVIIDSDRGRKAAALLFNAFSTTGIHGHTDMPEDILPLSLERGSLEHILFITLTVSIDYQRDATDLWQRSRQTFNDPSTRYLFDPKALQTTPLPMIIKDMQKYRLSRKPQKDASIWSTVGMTFQKKWQGDPRYFLKSYGWQALHILDHLRGDVHPSGETQVPDFPYLRGAKIGPLWLRMLRDNAGISEIQHLDQVPIPVDIHIGRATLALGIVRGWYSGGFSDLFESIRKAWFESVSNLQVGNRPMIALDVDEPLWHLSHFGCTSRDKQTGSCPLISSCEAKGFCISGKINIHNSSTIELDT